MKGMIVRDWLDRQDEFEKEVGGYFRAGKLKHKERWWKESTKQWMFSSVSLRGKIWVKWW